MAANIIISGSQYERRLISQRTPDAFAAKRRVVRPLPHGLADAAVDLEN
jgi:hypothetical protein